MIFRSNLTAPDIAQYFKLKSEPRGHSFGHDCPSDPDFEPDCTNWTHDEAAILYNVARDLSQLNYWLDIGCRFGWTAMHIMAAGGFVVCLDPQLKFDAQLARFADNTCQSWAQILAVEHRTATEYFALPGERRQKFDGFVIDADHDAPHPLNDALGCVSLAKPTAVIMFHDFYGAPIQDAVSCLLNMGWKARIYWTPNGVACCWRGDFEPPVHKGDPLIYIQSAGRTLGFDLARCS